MSDALDKAVVEFNKFIGTDIAYYDRGWEFLDAKISNLIALAKSEGKSEGLEEAFQGAKDVVAAYKHIPPFEDNELGRIAEYNNKTCDLILMRLDEIVKYEAVRAIDSLPSAVGGWRPVSEVPQEGRWIVMDFGGGHVLCTFWSGCSSLTGAESWKYATSKDGPLPTTPVNEEDL